MPGSGLFFDIDNTLITPQSHLFRVSSPYQSLIDDIKKQKEDFPHYEKIISNWRLARKVMLVDENWPNVMNMLKKNYAVYGLTKMDTGTFGSIPSMEEWRYNELARLGLHFSHQYQATHPLIKAAANFPYSAIYYQGIFLTGSYTKKEVIQTLFKSLTFPGISMVDDRFEELERVEEACQELKVPFKGVLFKGVETLGGVPNLQIAEFQKQYLIKMAQWLEDEEAAQKFQETFPH